jgi:SPP1 family predicted phage head-tail adaptor
MEAGRLRHVVDIKSVTEAQNTTGDTTLTLTTLAANVRANVKAVSGKEFRAASGQQKDLIAYEVDMRYRADLTPRMRLIWGTKTLEIVAILADRVGEWMRVQCGEIV